MISFTSAAEAETAFYHAFSQCDVQKMNNVWADGDVTCVHPGAEILQGKPLVMQSWGRILVPGMSASINIEPVSQVVAESMAVHVLYERLSPDPIQPPVTVIATNVYQLGPQGWKMIEHHGSQPLAQPALESGSDRVLQ